jgi:hypothetical protein
MEGEGQFVEEPEEDGQICLGDTSFGIKIEI